MEDIKPTTQKDKYTLEDKDYLLIKALVELTATIEKLRVSLN